MRLSKRSWRAAAVTGVATWAAAVVPLAAVEPPGVGGVSALGIPAR